MGNFSLDISRNEELLETGRGFSIRVPQRVQSKRCYEKFMGWNRNSVEIYFETISFVWLNLLVPCLSNLTSGKILFRGYKR